MFVDDRKEYYVMYQEHLTTGLSSFQMTLLERQHYSYYDVTNDTIFSQINIKFTLSEGEI